MWWIVALIILFLVGRVFTQSKEINGLKEDLGKMFAIIDDAEQSKQTAAPKVPQIKVAPPYRNGSHTDNMPKPGSAQMDPRGPIRNQPAAREQAPPPQAQEEATPNNLMVAPVAGSSGVSLEQLSQPRHDLQGFFS